MKRAFFLDKYKVLPLRVGFLAIFFVLLLTASCQKYDLPKPPIFETEQPNVTLTDVAHFQSQAGFERAMTALKNEGTIPVETKGITTLSQASWLKSGSLEGAPEDTLIYSDLLKSVLNENYEIAIGNVFFRITEYGTLFTGINNYQWLRELPVEANLLHYYQPITTALGYSAGEGMFALTSHSNLYMYDTYERILDEPLGGGVSPILIQPINKLPSEADWKDITDDRTGFGELWDIPWGFSKSVRNYFDDRNRVDVKFYAQRFLFYAEVGIKTKTQFRGWTGLWRKRYSDEIINGWEILNLREKWPSQLFTFMPPPDPNLGFIYFMEQFGQDLGWSQTVLANEHWKTFKILGFEIDFTKRDKLGALWNLAKTTGRLTVNFLNNRFVNPHNQREAIRIVPRNLESNVTEISLGPLERRRANTKKHTLIIGSDEGGIIHIRIPIGGGGTPNIGVTPVASRFTFLPNSVLYGAARIGNT